MVRIIVKEVFRMIIVQEEEKFWNITDWNRVFENYYKPLIESKKIDQFKWEPIDDPYYYIVRRTYWDMRPRGSGQDQSSDNGRRPKQLPPHFQVTVEATVEGGTAEQALEFMQNYKEYWPEGLDLKGYALGQAKGEAPYMLLSFANYDPPEEEEEESKDEDDEEYGDVMYDEE